MISGLAVFADGGILSGAGSGIVEPIEEGYPECIDDDSDKDDVGDDVDCDPLSLDDANGYP